MTSRGSEKRRSEGEADYHSRQRRDASASSYGTDGWVQPESEIEPVRTHSPGTWTEWSEVNRRRAKANSERGWVNSYKSDGTKRWHNVMAQTKAQDPEVEPRPTYTQEDKRSEVPWWPGGAERSLAQELEAECVVRRPRVRRKERVRHSPSDLQLEK